MGRHREPVLSLALVLAAALPASLANAAEDDPVLEELRRLRTTVEEQSRRLDAQSRRIAELEGRPAVSAGALQQAIREYAAAAAADPAVVSSVMRSKRGHALSLYGFLRIDLSHDTSRPQDSQLIAWIRSEDHDAPSSIGAPRNAGDFTMHGRQTRIGLDLAAPRSIEKLDDAKLNGKLEVDFYGGGSDSRAFIRMRKAYMTLSWDDLTLLAGQTGDVIAPLYATVNTDMAMWGAGNVGDRRPQVRFDYHPRVGEGQLFVQGAITLGGAVDQDDLDGDSYLDGETAEEPGLQGRLAYRAPLFDDARPLLIGVWGHYAEEDPQSEVAGHGRFESNLFGVDLTLPIYRRVLWLKGEYWRGKNMDDVRGGILQGVNLTDGSEVRGDGGWVELVYQPADWLTLHAGHGRDDPEDDDLGATGRAENVVWFVAARATFDDFCVGLEFLDWTTKYVDFGDGTNQRLTLFLAYQF